jgi:transcription antitermination factor NusG
LFPGYLFARFDWYRMVSKIRYTRGVGRVLGVTGEPTPVDDSVISLIRSQIGIDGVVRLALKPGDHVRIIDGPLRDFVGIFSSVLTPADRVRVLLTAINGRFRVVVNEELLEKLA